MNQNLYRLVFNAARGQVMAVSEVATSMGNSAIGESRSARTSASKTPLSLVSIAQAAIKPIVAAVALLALPLLAWPQVTADPTAAGSLKPQILNTANGVTQVNIQAPSAAGVSRNAYSQFDVSAKGVILNNATANVQTQLGGWIQNNGNLAAGSARVILNEVNSSSPSQLRGYVEVAGQRAEVIIANPAGIAVNGGGFINASGVTLTTGAPVLNGGNLDGYRVQRGTITVDGDGLDTKAADFSNIIARAVQVNAGIWAKDLKVTTGANEVNAANTNTTAIAGTGTAPSVALDVAALGGMYAGKITLVGTEAGVGVNNRGSVAASSGDLVVTVNGQLTNRGVLDGQTTAVRADDIQNVGTGRIYGDHIAIQANTLNNSAETANGTTSAAVIAARTRLDIGAQTITNSEHALILSAGDMAIGGSLDGSKQASGNASTLRNGSATIEALGNLSISADTLTNANDHFAYSEQLIDTQTNIYEAPWSQYYRIFNRYTYQPVVTQDDPAQLLAGGNIVINANQINNQQSKIIAGGNITAMAAAIDNQSVVAQQRVRDIGTQWSWGVTGGHDDCYPCHWVLDWGYVASGYDTTAYTTMPVASGVSGSNRSTSTTQARSTATAHTNPATSGVLNSALFRNTSNPAANYLIETDARFASYKTWLSSDYITSRISLDPSVTQKRLGDGFYEQRLINEQVAQLTGKRFLANYTSEEQQYEALMNAGVTYAQSYNLRPGIALTAEQVSRLTSDIVWLVEKDVPLPDGTTQRALVPQVYAMVRDGDLSNTGALFSGKSVQLATGGDITNSGIISAQQLGLKATNLNNNAGTVTGQQVSIATTQDINNKGGTLSALSSLSLTAGGDINNITGTQTASGANKTTLDRQAVIAVTGAAGQSGGQLTMVAAGDINLIASQVSSAGAAALSAGGSVNMQAATTREVFHNESHGEAEFRQHLEQSSQTGSTIHAKGDLTVSATQDISATAATIQSDANVTLQAGNTVLLVAGQNTRSSDLSWTATNKGLFSSSVTEERRTESSTQAVASNVSGNNVTLTSGNNIAVKGSNANAVQDLTLSAGKDVVIESAQATSSSSAYTKVTKSGFSGDIMSGVSFGNSMQAQDATNHTTTQVASTLGGRNVSIQSARDTTVAASNVLADQNISVVAGGKVDILAAANTQTSTNQSESSSTQIGLGGGLSGRLNIFSSNRTNGNGTSTSVEQSTSVLSANGGNLTVTANGGTLTTQGADLLAADTITLQGKTVDLQAIANQQTSTNHFESQSVTVGSALTGMVGSTLTAISDNVQLANTTQNERLKNAASLKAGYDAYKLVSGDSLDKLSKAGAAAGSANGDPSGSAIGVSISVGVSSSSQDSASSSTQSRGTNAQAKTLNVTATEGDLTATAAKLQADHIALQAARNVQLQAAANTSTVSSNNQSNNVGAGVTFGVGQQSGISFQLSASQAQGRANGTETLFDNTRITASNTLTVKSGADTTLAGAQLAGDSVKMEVGTSGTGQLNIQTLQDSSTYQSEQSSSGFSVSVCLPPLCVGGVPVTGNIQQSEQAFDHNYQSAVGQSGIAAGSGGFDIKVAGNTDLTGAAITSTATPDKNTLQTASLTSTDLDNRQSTHSSSSSTSVGYSGASPLATLAQNVVSNGLGNLGGGAGLPENGSQSSKTSSVISAGNIVITGTGDSTKDANSQQQVATLTSRDAKTANQSLSNTLTLQQAQAVQEKQKTAQENAQAGQLVGSVAFNVVGDIAAKNKWKDSSPQKIALHAIAGFIQASAAGQNGATGALAAMGNEALTKVVNEYIDKALPMPENATPEQQREVSLSRKALAESAASLLGATTVALAGGSNQQIAFGGAVALNADRFNRQLHPVEAQLIKDNAARYAQKQGISVERAEAELTQQAERNNDSAHAERLGSNDPQAQAFLKTLGAGQNMVDGLTGQTYQLFSADQATRDNHAQFGQYAKTSAPVQELLDKAYNSVYKPKDGQTIVGVNGSNAGALTGSDLALNDAARDYGNMRKQPAVVQWAVLGEIRQERQANLQNQLALTEELQRLNQTSDTSPAAANRRGEIINRLTQLDAENQTLRQASVEQIRAMGSVGLLKPINQREWGEGAGEAIASSGLSLKGISAASISGRLNMLREAVKDTQAATAAAKAEAVAVAKARVENNANKDGGVDPYAFGEAQVSAAPNSGGTASLVTGQKLANELAKAELKAIAMLDPRLASAARGGGDFASPNKKGDINFGIGSGTSAEADKLGKIWVGDGAVRTSEGGWQSADGTRTYRAPTNKPNTLGAFNPTGSQANFKYTDPATGVTTNGHMVIK